jgi:N-ethylmaleimide reductase
MARDASILFSPFRLGELQLPNRLVTASLTRNRATKGTDAPNDLNERCYRRRGSGAA